MDVIKVAASHNCSCRKYEEERLKHVRYQLNLAVSKYYSGEIETHEMNILKHLMEIVQ